ncbi:MAG: acyl carrier protein phosphodiesterase [Nitrococcus sp.]|nr:acyl carrier protein phosphodiesterase [Nitrococcus sp.]
MEMINAARVLHSHGDGVKRRAAPGVASSSSRNRDLDHIALALDRLSLRLPRISLLRRAVTEIPDCYRELPADFMELLPELARFPRIHCGSTAAP